MIRWFEKIEWRGEKPPFFPCKVCNTGNEATIILHYMCLELPVCVACNELKDTELDELIKPKG